MRRSAWGPGVTMTQIEIEPEGTYRPQFRLRFRGIVSRLDRFPRVKARLGDLARSLLRRFFDPGVVTTERVVEYPFLCESLSGAADPVLDVGCAHSGLAIALASRGRRVVGLDVAEFAYRHPNLRAVRGDVTSCPFAAGSFGAVVAISAVEHIGLGHYGDPCSERGDREAVREMARVLRHGGRAILSVPFGVALVDASKRVYDTPGLSALLAPLVPTRIEFARSRQGLWCPCSEAEAASVDWRGPDRAVALVVASTGAAPGGVR